MKPQSESYRLSLGSCLQIMIHMWYFIVPGLFVIILTEAGMQHWLVFWKNAPYMKKGTVCILLEKSTIYIKRCRNEERKAICYCDLYCVQEYFLKWNFPGRTFFKLFKSKTSLETCLEIVNEWALRIPLQWQYFQCHLLASEVFNQLCTLNRDQGQVYFQYIFWEM